jgi:hypothetical protein
MTSTGKQWILVSVISAALLFTLMFLGGGYRALGILFLPIGFWLSLRREPEQKEIRPAIRALGWILVCVALFALVASVLFVLAGR